MALPVVTDRQFAMPSAADGLTLATTGSAWTNTSWSEILAAADADLVLTGLVFLNLIGNAISYYGVEIDIGVGASGSESVVSTVRLHERQIFAPGGQQPSWYQPFPIGLDCVPNGSRVAVRLRIGATNSHNVRVALTYFKKPLSGTNYLTTTSPMIAIPAAADPIVVQSSATAWAFGSWVEMIASTAGALVITSVITGGLISGTISAAELELGVGASGSEVAVTRLRFLIDFNANRPGSIVLPNPLDNIGSGVRIAARMMSATQFTTSFALSGFIKPL